MKFPTEASQDGTKQMVKIDDDDIPAPIRESIERAQAKAPPPPGSAVPNYLACVYTEATSWQHSAKHKASIQKLYENHFHQRVQKSYFRFLIELSSGRHVSPQEKSKYVSVLKYAQASKVPPEHFVKFLKKHNGIKGCMKASTAGRTKAT
jgi:hypothetical protein